MRKRFVKSVAHWVIMSVILLFPVLMVGISSFGNHETINVVETQNVYYETNELLTTSDFIIGNAYQYNDNYNYPVSSDINFMVIRNNEFIKSIVPNNYVDAEFFKLQNGTSGNLNLCANNNSSTFVRVISSVSFPFEVVSILDTIPSSFVDSCTPYASLIKEVVQVEYQQNYYMREDVNQWCNTFRNLAVNQWYGDLLDTIGLGITNSMMMNVIYTYPLYVLWVYIIDLVVDCLLVIINFGHNALKRLGGDNE